MQNYSRDFLPVSPLALGLQKACVRRDMLLVIERQHRIVRSAINDIWV
ncbi:hypothetical protein V1283_006593 [Bradyrhizobium sp. AZCC 2262]